VPVSAVELNIHGYLCALLKRIIRTSDGEKCESAWNAAGIFVHGALRGLKKRECMQIWRLAPAVKFVCVCFVKALLGKKYVQFALYAGGKTLYVVFGSNPCFFLPR
jgi:hypothetical protein